jgi:hypothetical protein
MGELLQMIFEIAFELIGEPIVRALLSGITLILATPFVLVVAAIRAGSYFANVADGYRTVLAWFWT